MAERPPADATPLGRFLEQYSKDAEARVSRTLDDYLALFPGDSEHVAEEFLALRRFQEQGEQARSPAIPQQISHYRIIKEIGRGGQGVVYLAKDVKLGREVAIKMLRRSRLALEELERLQREARIASRLDHPGICPVYDIGDYGGEPYLVMRYVRGTSLAQKLEQIRKTSATTFTFVDVSAEPVPTPVESPKPPDYSPAAKRDLSTPSGKEVQTVLRLIEQVARALHEAHEAQIVHRDVKPGNIIVTPEGQPVLLDFGVATMTGDGGVSVTRTGETPGTPQYMSPEQTSGKHLQLDRRTDVYSLGVTLYECLTLRLPFGETTDISRQIMFVPPPDPRRLNSAISRELKVVIETALEKDRNRRYGTAADFADDLRRVRDHEPIKARPVGLTVRFLRWTQRNPAIAASVISTMVVLLAALLFMLGALRKSQLAEEKERAQKEMLDHARSLYEPLVDLTRVNDLEQWAASLWPAYAKHIAGPDGMDGWIAEAEALLERQPERESALRAIEAGATAMPVVDRKRRVRVLKELTAQLGTLPRRIREMTRRRESAKTVEDRTIGQFRGQWAEIAGELSRDPRFAAISRLEPQLGLIPLGKNGAGLFEFAIADSGAIPTRPAESRPLDIRDDSAAILVLLPGGTLAFDPRPEFARPPSKKDLISVVILPFFLGAHEVTQAQWIGLMGANPSVVQVGRQPPPLSERHPVENITWFQAEEFCHRIGGRLPSQDEWEHGARAIARAEFGDFDRVEELEGRENLADLEFVKVLNQRVADQMDWNDGYGYHAPVGSFRPNGFGLYDMLGNVAELCSDRYVQPRRPSSETLPASAGEPSDPRRVYRGGSWQDGARYSNCRSYRLNDPHAIQPRIGLRLARSVAR